MNPPARNGPPRLVSLDVLRGLAVAGPAAGAALGLLAAYGGLLLCIRFPDSARAASTPRATSAPGSTGRSSASGTCGPGG